ncbi:ureidoglycolate dehydrogenase (NAD+) [Bradyrhizobium macuxiense]|uniref:Ureidoglycolate dehydrogenase (NAD+) n=1 Tax=Bradyrhizobium macuxiense TaxID=1755647 RepID=A0A560KXE4_9BRAD|nr:Ldh family oxidoreductase [Bradyrhizobium macuxiense]TWB87789.1 ureidoglycolate dehydrogenase (NAD+) [Bradyrhizobium macuxiense]
MGAASSTKKNIAHSDLLAFAAALLKAGGFAAHQADQTAEILVWANLRGIDSHGVLRIPRYVEMVELGLINPSAEISEVTSKGAMCVVDADCSPGAVAMNYATRMALLRADDHGLGWCSVRGMTHAGAIGFYAERIAKQGRVAIVMTASKPLMVYFGSRAEGVSTNPLAIAAPTLDPNRPLLLDMSTAAVALGKIMAAKDAGVAIPPGWGVDQTGQETTDPAKVKAVLPMAGPKGSGLSLMIEVLASVLSGNPLVAAALNRGGDPGANGLVVALDPTAFCSDTSFAGSVSELCEAIKKLPPAVDTEGLYLPGERGFNEMERRLRSGIPVPAGTLSRLAALASKLGISVAQALQ